MSAIHVSPNLDLIFIVSFFITLQHRLTICCPHIDHGRYMSTMDVSPNLSLVPGVLTLNLPQVFVIRSVSSVMQSRLTMVDTCKARQVSCNLDLSFMSLFIVYWRCWIYIQFLLFEQFLHCHATLVHTLIMEGASPYLSICNLYLIFVSWYFE